MKKLFLKYFCLFIFAGMQFNAFADESLALKKNEEFIGAYLKKLNQANTCKAQIVQAVKDQISREDLFHDFMGVLDSDSYKSGQMIGLAFIGKNPNGEILQSIIFADPADCELMVDRQIITPTSCNALLSDAAFKNVGYQKDANGTFILQEKSTNTSIGGLASELQAACLISQDFIAAGLSSGRNKNGSKGSACNKIEADVINRYVARGMRYGIQEERAQGIHALVIQNRENAKQHLAYSIFKKSNNLCDLGMSDSLLVQNSCEAILAGDFGYKNLKIQHRLSSGGVILRQENGNFVKLDKVGNSACLVNTIGVKHDLLNK